MIKKTVEERSERERKKEVLFNVIFKEEREKTTLESFKAEIRQVWRKARKKIIKESQEVNWKNMTNKSSNWEV
jgi:hypothetical protein